MTPIDLFYLVPFLSIFLSAELTIMMVKKITRRKRENRPELEVPAEKVVQGMQDVSVFMEYKYKLLLQFLCTLWAVAGIIISDMRLLFIAWIFLNMLLPIFAVIIGKTLKATDLVVMYALSIVTCLIILYKHFFLHIS